MSKALHHKRSALLMTDGKLITSRKPDHIPAFNQAIEQALAAA